MSTSYAERRKHALRQEIIDAAFTCFAERGYQHTGVADIAERVGIGNSTFYRQFESKQQILAEVIDTTIARLLASLTAENAPEAVQTIDEYRAQVERISYVIGDIARDDRAIRLLLIQSMTVGPELEQKVQSMLATFVSLTARYIAHGKHAGYLRQDLDTESTARAVVSLILGGLYLGLDPGIDRSMRRSSSRAALDLIFHGVTAEDRR